MQGLLFLLVSICVGLQYDEELAQDSALFAFAAYQNPSNFSKVANWTCDGCCEKMPDVSKVKVVLFCSVLFLFEKFCFVLFLKNKLFLNDTRVAFGFVASWSSMRVVSFRGTVASSFRNWLDDLQYSKLAT